MKSCKCPSCKQVAFSWLSKLLLGPARTKECANCGAKLSVPYYSLLTVIPFVLCITLSPNMPQQTIFVAVLVGFIIMSFLHIKFIPLILRKN